MTTDTPTENASATLAEIKAAAPGCSSDFAVEQLEANATIEQVRAAHQKALADRIAALEKENNDLAAANSELEQSAASSAAAGSDGSDPVGEGSANTSTSTDSTDPVAAWNDVVAEKMSGGLTRQKAVAACVRGFPEVHRAYLKTVQS